MSSLNPLYITSDGYLHNCNDTLMPSVNGYWYICGDEVEEVIKKPVKKGSSKFSLTDRVTIIKEDDILPWNSIDLKTEDQEILLIIKIFMKCQ